MTSTSGRVNLWLSASLDLSKEGLVGHPDEQLDATNEKPGYQDGAGYYGNKRRQMNEHVSPQGMSNQPLIGRICELLH